MKNYIKGVVPILLVPFDEFGNIDKSSLKREIEYSIDAGVHGLGIAIVSTPKGVMTDIDARKQKIGGEIICKVF